MTTPSPRPRDRRGRTRYRRRAKTWDELRALLRVACPPMRRLLLATWVSRARPDELRRLRWPAVDLAGRKIRVKGDGPAQARTIHIGEQMAALLRWLKAHARDTWVFTGPNGQHSTPSALARCLGTIRRKAGLPLGVTIYGHPYRKRAKFNAQRRAKSKAQRAAAKAEARRQHAAAKAEARRQRRERPARPSPEVRIKALVERIESMAAAVVAGDPDTMNTNRKAVP